MDIALVDFGPALQEIVSKGQWLLIVIVLDLVLGITAAIKAKDFQWDKVADFLADYAPKVIGWMALEFLAVLPTDLLVAGQVMDGAATLAYMAIIVSGLGSILKSVKGFGILLNFLPGAIRPKYGPGAESNINGAQQP